MLTDKQKATNCETHSHILRVQELLNQVIVELIERGHKHDRSKLDSPEVELLTEHGDKRSALTYDSMEYKQNLSALQPALEHHYAHNRHHPQHHKDGINDMTLIDLIEMLCDWKGSSEIQNNGNILKSIEKNSDRFGISPQLTTILENTAKELK